jgi:geranylgeranyl diphosphate synthase type I
LGWVDQSELLGRETLSKMVRATLCLVSCRALGGDYRTALPAAVAIELIHNFSLIHDDIEDASTERHHRATVWKLWGEAQAINAGDAMFALAHLALLRLREKGIVPEKLASSLKILNEACFRLCEGQYLDITYEDRIDITVEDYLDMINKKTAALMAASTCLGALLALELEGENERMLDSYYLFGKELGLAYQIRDDILGIWGLEKKTGKPTGGDISKRKKTLPVVYVLQKSGKEDKERLLEVYRKTTIEDSDITKVTEILNRVNAKSYSQALALRYHNQALKRIGGKLSAELKEIADFFIERDY